MPTYNITATKYYDISKLLDGEPAGTLDLTSSPSKQLYDAGIFSPFTAYSYIRDYTNAAAYIAPYITVGTHSGKGGTDYAQADFVWLKFDTSSIPAIDTVNSSSLFFHAWDGNPGSITELHALAPAGASPTFSDWPASSVFNTSTLVSSITGTGVNRNTFFPNSVNFPSKIVKGGTTWLIAIPQGYRTAPGGAAYGTGISANDSSFLPYLSIVTTAGVAPPTSAGIGWGFIV